DNFASIHISDPLKVPMVADAKLKAAATIIVFVRGNRDAVIQPQRADGQVQTQAQAPVVVINAGVKVLRVKTVSVTINHAGVIEHSKPQPLNNGNAVFGRAEPVGIAANRFLEFISRPDLAKTESAQGIDATQEPFIEQRHV